jgi:hypothetical protein
MVLDLRQVIGSRVNAKKALHVRNKAECSRRYDAATSTKGLEGTVLGTDKVLIPPNCWSSWFITANYDIGADFMKTKRLNILSVKNGETPSVALPGSGSTSSSTSSYSPTNCSSNCFDPFGPSIGASAPRRYSFRRESGRGKCAAKCAATGSTFAAACGRSGIMMQLKFWSR